MTESIVRTLFDVRVAALGLGLALSATAHAGIVASFGNADVVTGNKAVTPTIVESTGDFDGDADATDYRYLAAFDDATPIPFSSYTGPALVGGALLETYDGATDAAAFGALPRHIMRNDGADDFYRFQILAGSPIPADVQSRAAVAVMMLKDQFIGDAATNPVEGNSLSIQTAIIEGLDSTYLLVQNGGTYYVSKTNFDAVSDTLITTDFSGDWAVWDQSLDFDVASAAVAAVTFDDIQGVGILGQTLVPADPENYLLNIDTITLDGNVVPEPTTLALLGLGGLMVARRRRA